MANVHFWGVDNVVKAYNQRGVESWAVCQGKQMLNKGDNAEDLATYLKTLWQDSQAVFVLNVYELDVDNIKPSTPNDGSFNFKLSTQNHGQAVSGSENVILSKLEALELKFAELEIDEGETDRDPDMWERISGLLEKPAVVGLINKLTGMNMQPVSKIGSVPPGDQDREIESAIAVLKTKDPFLGTHLTKLAKMAIDNPANFKFLLSTLDSLP